MTDILNLRPPLRYRVFAQNTTEWRLLYMVSVVRQSHPCALPPKMSMNEIMEFTSSLLKNTSP